MSFCERAMEVEAASIGNNSDNITVGVVSSSDYENFEIFHQMFRPVHKYLCMILCIIGILANGSTMVVLSRPQMKSVANTILILIAGCDFALITSYLIYLTHSRFITFLCDADEFPYSWTVFTLFHANLCVYSKACSLWLAVVLAGYRRHLLSSAKLGGVTNRGVCKIIFICFVLIFIFCVPLFISYNVVGHSVPESQLGLWCPNGTIFYAIQPYDYAEFYDCFLTKFNFWISGLVFKLLPCCCLAYCLVWIIFLMINRSKKRLQLTRTSAAVKKGERRDSSDTDRRRRPVKTNHHTTLILTLILSLTLLCELPCVVVSVLAGIFPKEFFNSVYRNLGDFFDALSLLNGITTFPLYCFMSASFRSTFVDIFLLPFKSKHQLISTLNERLSI